MSDRLASWQVADLQSWLMIHIGVRAGEHEGIDKRYLALSQAQCGRAGSLNLELWQIDFCLLGDKQMNDFR